jgi:hypothetical protein
MSLIKLQGNASGTGAFTIAAPNGNTDRTLTLPDATGTVNVSGLANEVPAGSAGAPAIYPTGDTNTGIFFPAADTVGFSAGGTERVRIDANGIKFNGDTASANGLDDYEEGNWTPTFGASTTNPSVTYTVQTAVYVKVGQSVHVMCDIQASSISGGSGVAFIRGLPFVVGTDSLDIPTFRDATAIASGGANTMLVGFAQPSAQYIQLQFNGINGSYGTAGNAVYNASGRITLSVTYRST